MEYVINRPGHVDVIGNIGARDPELRVFHQMRDIRIHAGDEIVQRQHFPVFSKESVAKMRSQKSRPAGDHRSHASSATYPRARGLNSAAPFPPIPGTAT